MDRTRTGISTDVGDLEIEINRDFYNNPDLELQDLRLFMKITDYSYWPVTTYIANGKIYVQSDNSLKNKEFYMGSRRQYIYHGEKPTSGTNKYTIPAKFATAWNKDKFLFFINGKYIGRNHYKMIIPSPNNGYKYKKVIFDFLIPSSAQLDTIYVESDDNFDEVPYNRDLRVSSVEVYGAERGPEVEKDIAFLSTKSTNENEWYQGLTDYYSDTRRKIKVPYPYIDYPRGKNTFFVFHSSHQLLMEGVDYTISEDGDFITLEYSKRLADIFTFVNIENYLSFVFPYLKADWEGPDYEDDEETGFGEKSGVTYHVVNTTTTTSTGLVTFPSASAFNKYPLTKDEIIVMGNTVFIDPSRYNLISNNQIQFLSTEDKADCVGRYYTMIVFSETKSSRREQLQYIFSIHELTATSPKQVVFKLPKKSQEKDFLIFRGSTLMEQENRYIWDKPSNTITLTNMNDCLLKGQQLNVLYFKPRSTKVKKGIEIIPVHAQITTDGKVKIPNDMVNYITFNKQNLLLFLNTVYIEPERYTLSGNTVTFTDATDATGKDTGVLVKGKEVTGIVLKEYTVKPDPEGKNPPLSYRYVNMTEDHDFVWFDEQVAQIYK